eukprot:Rhum_TRINITY_DN13038_c0_g1::Rhum_TRINITY_DN13038_c0_g1_i1::g.56159::m.56159
MLLSRCAPAAAAAARRGLRAVPAAAVTRAAEARVGRAAAGQQRLSHDSSFDEDIGEIMGPSLTEHEMTEKTLPQGLRPFVGNLVRVAGGIGFVFRSDRDAPHSNIRRGDVLIATATCIVTQHMGKMAELCRMFDGRTVALDRVLSQKRAMDWETSRTGMATLDHGVTILVPTKEARGMLQHMQAPKVSVQLRGGRYLFALCPARLGNEKSANEIDFHLNHGIVDQVMPVLSMSDFGPKEFQQSYIGAPLFYSGDQRGIHGVDYRVSNMHGKKANVVLVGVITGFDHSDPYDPQVTLGSLKSALAIPLAVSTRLENGRWASHFPEVRRIGL